MLNEFRLPGAKVVRWLRREPTSAHLLLEAGFDDGVHEHLWRVTSVVDGDLSLRCEETARARRLPDAGAIQGVFILPPDHPLRAAVAAAQDPAERALEIAAEALHPHLRGALHNLMDAPLILEAIHMADDGVLPDRELRGRQAYAIKANLQHRLGVKITQRWRDAVLKARRPMPFDVEISLVYFLHQARNIGAAVVAVRRALDLEPPSAAEALLRRQSAALLIEMFDQTRRRDTSILDAAEKETSHAYALSRSLPWRATQSLAAPDINKLYEQLKSRRPA